MGLHSRGRDSLEPGGQRNGDFLIRPDVIRPKKEFGKTMRVIADDLFPNAGESQKKSVMQKCCVYEQEALTKTEDNLLYPKVTETLRALSETHRLYIVSNCQSGYIELFLQKTGTQKYILDFECFGNTGMGKAENIRLLMKRNRLSESETAYVGDTRGDREAAASAGIPFIHAGYGFGRVENCPREIENFSELLNF